MSVPQSPITAKKHLNILIIDHNRADSRLIVEAFKEVGLTEGVECKEDGNEALAYLRREEKYSEAALPHIIFLDLSLPKKPGLVVLAEIKNNPVLKVIPVVVVSGSHDPKQIREAYELHACCFVYKPGDLNELINFIRVCYEFWGTYVVLPPME
jgi:two-component system, chemotaxis family, response regulator Rcp1